MLFSFGLHVDYIYEEVEKNSKLGASTIKQEIDKQFVATILSAFKRVRITNGFCCSVFSFWKSGVKWSHKG